MNRTKRLAALGCAAVAACIGVIVLSRIQTTQDAIRESGEVVLSIDPETVQSEKGASGKMRRASKQMNEDKRALAANALERGKVEREWLKCEAFLRESNYSALLFSVNFSIAFRRLYADKTPDEADAFVRRRMIGLEDLGLKRHQ